MRQISFALVRMRSMNCQPRSERPSLPVPYTIFLPSFETERLVCIPLPLMPVTGINGSGMHTNLSVSQKGKNLFFDARGPDKLSKLGYKFIDRILTSGQDTCLIFNASVNAYRRLDPHFEAPNQIKSSAVDRG